MEDLQLFIPLWIFVAVCLAAIGALANADLLRRTAARLRAILKRASGASRGGCPGSPQDPRAR